MHGDAIELDRLDVLRALAEPTRNQLYRELQGASGPLTTSELARRLGLHPNTVRAHLDRLCDVGLARSETSGDGQRGRPRHRFRAAVGPSAGAAPGGPPTPLAPAAELPAGANALARTLLRIHEVAGVEAAVMEQVARHAGRERAQGLPDPATVEDAVTQVAEGEATEGYAPTVELLAPGRWGLTFLRCPNEELATAAPQVVCRLHAETLRGACEHTGRLRLDEFVPLSGDRPCHAVVSEAPLTVARDRR